MAAYGRSLNGQSLLKKDNDCYISIILANIIDYYLSFIELPVTSKNINEIEKRGFKHFPTSLFSNRFLMEDNQGINFAIPNGNEVQQVCEILKDLNINFAQGFSESDDFTYFAINKIDKNKIDLNKIMRWRLKATRKNSQNQDKIYKQKIEQSNCYFDIDRIQAEAILKDKPEYFLLRPSSLDKNLIVVSYVEIKHKINYKHVILVPGEFPEVAKLAIEEQVKFVVGLNNIKPLVNNNPIAPPQRENVNFYCEIINNIIANALESAKIEANNINIEEECEGVLISNISSAAIKVVSDKLKEIDASYSVDIKDNTIFISKPQQMLLQAKNVKQRVDILISKNQELHASKLKQMQQSEFYFDFSDTEAEKLLRDKKPGTFLLRKSSVVGSGAVCVVFIEKYSEKQQRNIIIHKLIIPGEIAAFNQMPIEEQVKAISGLDSVNGIKNSNMNNALDSNDDCDENYNNIIITPTKISKEENNFNSHSLISEKENSQKNRDDKVLEDKDELNNQQHKTARDLLRTTSFRDDIKPDKPEENGKSMTLRNKLRKSMQSIPFFRDDKKDVESSSSKLIIDKTKEDNKNEKKEEVPYRKYKGREIFLLKHLGGETSTFVVYDKSENSKKDKKERKEKKAK